MITPSNNKPVSKWKKWLWVLLVLAGTLAYCTREKEITHIVLSDEVTRIEIPPEIVKSKDCNKYHEWFYSHMTPLTVASDRCPWAKPPKGEIGEFVVNGEKFWVPRGYLWQDSMEPDGHVGSLHLMMLYHDMRPSTDKKEERDLEIRVTIRSTYNWDDCRLRGQCDAAHYNYVHITDLNYLTEEEKKVYPKNMGYIPEIDLTVYKFNTIRSFYIRGNKYKPSYWLACDGGISGHNWNPGCHSYFNWSNKLYVEYVFRKTALLQRHDEVRRKLTEKIQEFQQEPRGKK